MAREIHELDAGDVDIFHIVALMKQRRRKPPAGYSGWGPRAVIRVLCETPRDPQVIFCDEVGRFRRAVDVSKEETPVLTWLAVSGTIGALIARATDNAPTAGAFLGIFLGPIGWLIQALMKSDPNRNRDLDAEYHEARRLYEEKHSVKS